MLLFWLFCSSERQACTADTVAAVAMPPTTLGPSWSLLCWNLTVVGRLQDGHSPAPVALWPAVAVTPPSVNVSELHRDNDGIDDRDRHALLYIVVVLLFYSTGIVVGIVMYLKREKAEIEEEKAYENYARSAAPQLHTNRVPQK